MIEEKKESVIFDDPDFRSGIIKMAEILPILEKVVKPRIYPYPPLKDKGIEEELIINDLISECLVRGWYDEPPVIAKVTITDDEVRMECRDGILFGWTFDSRNDRMYTFFIE